MRRPEITNLYSCEFSPTRNRLLLSVVVALVMTTAVGCTPPATPLDLVNVDVEVAGPSVERCNIEGEAFKAAAEHADAVDRRANDEAAVRELLDEAERTGDYGRVNGLLLEHVAAFEGSAVAMTRAVDMCSSFWKQDEIEALRDRIELIEQTTHDLCLLYDLLYSEHGLELEC